MSITADEPITVVVAKEGAAVSLAGATGGAEVVALENNVAGHRRPRGHHHCRSGKASPAPPPTARPWPPILRSPLPLPPPGGGGGTPTPDRPITITIGDKHYVWDDDEEEYLCDGEALTAGDLKEAGSFEVDGKEYVYNADADEWFNITDDEEEDNPISTDDIVGGTDVFEPVS